jgi:hypothetical protein
LKIIFKGNIGIFGKITKMFSVKLMDCKLAIFLNEGIFLAAQLIFCFVKNEILSFKVEVSHFNNFLIIVSKASKLRNPLLCCGKFSDEGRKSNFITSSQKSG